MQGDGNFVLYNAKNEPRWASDTERNPGSSLVFGDSCNILIVSPEGKKLWDSQNTCGNDNDDVDACSKVVCDNSRQRRFKLFWSNSVRIIRIKIVCEKLLNSYLFWLK